MTSEEVVLDGQLHSYLQTFVENLKLTDSTFRVTKGCKKGDNFVGLVYSVRIEGIENGETKSKHLILKTVSSVNSKILQPRKLYLREIFFYQKVVPIFKETLREHGGIVELFPAFYDANDEPGNEILVLENLTRKGFTLKKNSRLLDYPHAALVIRHLAEFHAYSFIVRAADPTSFEKLKQMEEPMFSRELNRSNSSKELIDVVVKLLMDEGKHYAERFQTFADSMFENIVDAVDGSLAEPYAVVNHGDVWTNNILFKYDQVSKDSCEEKKIPCDLRFLDFQLCRYASPALDLTYMLFCSCTHETRIKYYDQLIREYHETLSTYLKRFGFDPNVLFPYEALSDQLASFGKYAAGMVYLVLYFVTDTEGSDISVARDVKKFEQRIQNDSLFRNTLKGALTDLIDRNFI